MLQKEGKKQTPLHVSLDISAARPSQFKNLYGLFLAK